MPEVIYEDEHLIAINKPHGLLVHKTRIAKDATEFALQQVRNYHGAHVYPAHRLDRKTSGVLLFTKSETANKEVQALFRNRQVEKKYLAIVRGFTEVSGTIDYPLSEDTREPKDAVTHYQTIEQFEIPLVTSKFPSSRYSIIELKPETGRFHQLRKHMAHIFHPILGDRPHGCNKQNRIWKHQLAMDKMMLHAQSLELEYPSTNRLVITAEPSSEYKRVLSLLKDPSTIPYIGNQNQRT